VAGEAFAKQVELVLLDRVFHLAPDAVALFVERNGGVCRRGPIGDDETRVVLVAEILGLADDTPRARVPSASIWRIRSPLMSMPATRSTTVRPALRV